MARLAGRLSTRIPAGALPTVIELASVAGDVPLVGLPAFRRAMVVAPHPDDETIGPGGTGALLAGRGAEVGVVIVTDGEASIGSPHGRSETARRRRAEAVTACRCLGVADPSFLSLPDGGVSGHVDDLAAELATFVERHRPNVVFAPWVGDRHPDHRAVTRALARLDLGGTEVWGYEVHDPTVPNRAVDISAVVTRKRAALAAHATAGLALNLEATLALNRWRSLGVRGGNGWAECFHAVGGDELRALVERSARETAQRR